MTPTPRPSPAELLPGSIDLRLPLPPAAVSPNSRGHWATRAKAVKHYRADCGWTARGLTWPVPVPVAHAELRIRYVLCRPPAGAYRPLDPDNAQASIKAAIDGIRDAGLIAGDDQARLSIVGCTIERHGRHRRGEACAGSGLYLTLRAVEATGT